MIWSCGLGLVFVGGAEGAFGLGDGEEGWIELDEGGIDCGVSGVAGVAGLGGGNHLGGFVVVESEERPFAGEAGFVFDMDFDVHVAGLEVALLIDGAFAFCSSVLEHDHGLVGPGAGFDEGLVGFGVDEDVVEHVVAGHLHAGGIAHVEAGGQVDPFAVVPGKVELAVGGVDRGWCVRGIALGDGEGESEGAEQKGGLEWHEHRGSVRSRVEEAKGVGCTVTVTRCILAIRGSRTI